MIMIEDGNMDIKWECSKCKMTFEDKDGFENKITSCSNCNDDVDEFIGLFDDEGNYA